MRTMMDDKLCLKAEFNSFEMQKDNMYCIYAVCNRLNLTDPGRSARCNSCG